MSGDLFGWEEPPAARYPEVAGSKERSLNSASRKAAESVPAGTLRASVLGDLQENGDATADECAARLGIDVLSIRPRFSELRRLGKIVATDQRRPSSRNTSSTVWKAAAP
jgi:hypothetical protein